MTNTKVALWPSDRAALLAVWEAREALIDSMDIAYVHSSECFGSAECWCPDLPNPVLGPMWSVLAVSMQRALGEEIADAVLERVERGEEFASVLDQFAELR